MRATNFVFKILGVLVVLLVTACTTENNPMYQTAAAVWHDPTTRVDFRPGFEYLQLEIDGRRSYMVLGSRQSNGAQVEEYWYSGAREMLHLRDGRLVQAVGLTREVRRTSSGNPEWSNITPRAQVWVRERDLMPHYQYGVKQFVISQQIQPTAQERALAPQAVRWVQEQTKTRTSEAGEWVYDEYFALGDHDQVVYSRQCIAQDLCLALTPLGGMSR